MKAFFRSAGCALALTVMAVVATASAQSGEWRNYTYTGTIESMADGGEYLWLGTRGGLVRFTKATAERSVYTKANSPLRGNWIGKIAVDNRERVWVLPSNSFAILDHNSWTSYPGSASSVAFGRDDTVWCSTGDRIYSMVNGQRGKRSYLPPKGGINSIDRILLDSIGRVWGTFGSDRAIGFLTDTGWTVTFSNDFGSATNNLVRAICADTGGSVLVGTYSSLVRFDGERTTRLLPNDSLALDPVIYSLCKDRRGRIWVATGHEVAMLDGSRWNVYHFDSLGLSYTRNYVSSMLVDDDGVLWMGIDGGVISFDGAVARRHETTTNGLLAGDVRSIAFDPQGTAWIGTANGVVRFDGTAWTTFTTENSGLPGNDILKVVCAPSGAVWFAANGGVAKYEGGMWQKFTSADSTLPKNLGRTLAIDHRGDVWTCGYTLARFDGSGWVLYDTAAMNFKHSTIESIGFDSSNNVWIGMYEGVATYDGAEWRYFHENDSAETIDTPSSLVVDPSGRLIIGSARDGVYTLSNMSEWGRIKVEPGGLVGRDASATALDKLSNLWFGGGWAGEDKGVQRFDGTDWTLYDVSNSGLPEGNVTAIAFDSAGAVWFGTREGIGVLGGAVSSVTLPSFESHASTGATLSVMPNPAHSRATVAYNVAESVDEHIRLSVIDAMGRTVLTLIDEKQEAGPHTVTIETSRLTPGWYAVRLQCDGARSVASLIVAEQ